MDVDPIKTWHIVIAGRLQDQGEPNGMVGLWRALGSQYSSPTTQVAFHAWSDCASTIAETVFRFAGERMPQVAIHAYSWGCMTARNVCQQLLRRGICGVHLVLSDPVYRHWYRLGWWRSLWPWSTIKLPPGIGQVTCFAQDNPLFLRNGRITINPRGHRVERYNGSEVEAIHSDRTHQYMDELPGFRRASMDLAKEMSICAA